MKLGNLSLTYFTTIFLYQHCGNHENRVEFHNFIYSLFHVLAVLLLTNNGTTVYLILLNNVVHEDVKFNYKITMTLKLGIENHKTYRLKILRRI